MWFSTPYAGKLSSSTAFECTIIVYQKYPIISIFWCYGDINTKNPSFFEGLVLLDAAQHCFTGKNKK